MAFDIDVFRCRLKELRAEKGISARKLGAAVGLSDAAIINWENGRRIPNAEGIYLLAQYFNVTAGYLLGLEN